MTTRDLSTPEDFRIRSVVTPTGCWEWQTNLNHCGYGRIGREYVHRLVAALFIGDVTGKVVMHQCDNPPCCNPEHLSIGSQTNNMIDAWEKGRIGPPRLVGDAHPLRRREECPNGHSYTQANTRWTADGRRCCRTCRREMQRRYRAKAKANG